MFSHDQEVIKYVMEAVEEGIATRKIKEEIIRLSHEESHVSFSMSNAPLDIEVSTQD